MTPAPPLMTADEYFKTPVTVKPAELIYGAMRVADSPTPRHQSAVLELVRTLDAHVREHELGELWLAPLDVVLDYDRALIVQPDLFFISRDGVARVAERVYGAPDLVIEVLSPGPRIGSTDERLGWFAEYGVRECWLVHQDDLAVTVVRFDDGGITGRDRYTRRQPIVSKVLPAFQASLDQILATPQIRRVFPSVLEEEGTGRGPDYWRKRRRR